MQFRYVGLAWVGWARNISENNAIKTSITLVTGPRYETHHFLPSRPEVVLGLTKLRGLNSLRSAD